jgi:hypothetical protein
VALRSTVLAMKVQMKPHTGMQGVVVGVLLMAFSNTAQGDLPLPLLAAVAFMYLGGLALASWGVWSWWSDRRSNRSRSDRMRSYHSFRLP